MRCYRIDYRSGNARNGRATSRLWIDSPNLLCAVIIGWWQIRRHHRAVSTKPGVVFSVTLDEDQ